MIKQTHKELISNFLASPSALSMLRELEAILEEEDKRRQQFYLDEITELKKVEFINGEIIIHSPPSKLHIEVCGALFRLISTYVDSNDLGFVGIGTLMIQLTRNDYEPDICFFDQKTASQLKREQTLFPAPKFIAAILSKSTASRDRGVKFEDYQNHGVGEYWIVDPQKRVVEQYLLQHDKYELVFKAGKGEISVHSIEGLHFQIEAIFDPQLANQEMKRLLLNQ
ncbi:MAG: Uma2 family endonuclease [Bacteroidota bacterium]